MVHIKEMLSKSKNAADATNSSMTVSVKEFGIVFLQAEILTNYVFKCLIFKTEVHFIIN